MLIRSVSLAAIASVLAVPAAANEVGAIGSVDSAEDQPILVEGHRGYELRRTRSATRTDTDIMSIPQSVTAVGEQQIDDQAFRSLGDVLRYVPGVMVGQGEGHRDQVTLRGNNTTADFFIDGLRDDIQYYRPLYNLERVEVLRGPNAMIFGRGGGGGIINRVTKAPIRRSLIAGSAAVDSFGAWHADADLNLPLGELAAARLNAVYEEFDNHRDFFEGRLFAINPTLALFPGSDTRIDFFYEHVDDERVVDRGVPAARVGTIADPARPLTGFRNTFFGDPAVNQMDFAGHILRGTVDHRFGGGLRLTSRLLYADYDKSYRNIFAASALRAAAGGGREVGLEAYRDAFQRENLFSQTDLVWDVTTGAVAHTFLAGVEFGRQDTGNQRLIGYFGNDRRAFVPLADRIAAPTVQFRSGLANGERSTRSDTDVFAVYLQDQMRIGPVEIVAGIRYDRFSIDVDDLMTGVRTGRRDGLFSPRLGLIFHPVENVALWASYSRSYLPQAGDQFNALDVTGAALEPERFDNYEIGARWQVRPEFIVSAAAYQLDRTNTRSPGPTSGTVVQTGEQRSRGIELEAVGQLMPGWYLSAGYALQEAEIVTRTTACDPAARRCEVPQVPRHSLSAWTRYDVTPRIGAGIGFHHQSESFATISNAVALPAYTRVDAALFFRLAPAVLAQLNVENLFGEDYFPTAHSDNNISTGAPRSIRATVRFGF